MNRPELLEGPPNQTTIETQTQHQEAAQQSNIYRIAWQRKSLVILGIMLGLVLYGHGHSIQLSGTPDSSAGSSGGGTGLWQWMAHAGQRGLGAGGLAVAQSGLDRLDAELDQVVDLEAIRAAGVRIGADVQYSLLVAFTLTPMMSARLLRPERERKHTRLGAWSARSYDRMVARYGDMLDWVLDRPRATMAVFALTLALTGLLYVLDQRGLLPAEGVDDK